MTKSPNTKKDWIQSTPDRLDRSDPIRARIKGIGLLHIDRCLPFLCVYRPRAEMADPGTRSLISSEAACLIISNPAAPIGQIRDFLRQWMLRTHAIYGAFCLVEVWASTGLSNPEEIDDGGIRHPHFRVLIPTSSKTASKTAQELASQLSRIKIMKQHGKAAVIVDAKWGRPNAAPLLTTRVARSANCLRIGIEVAPIFRDIDQIQLEATGHTYEKSN